MLKTPNMFIVAVGEAKTVSVSLTRPSILPADLLQDLPDSFRKVPVESLEQLDPGLIATLPPSLAGMAGSPATASCRAAQPPGLPSGNFRSMTTKG
jgi:hypothetical protein